MRVRGLDPTASGKEVENTCEHAKEVAIPYTAQKRVTSRDSKLPSQEESHSSALFIQSVLQSAS